MDLLFKNIQNVRILSINNLYDSCKSVVICLTALNYVYSQFDPDIGIHDIICESEEIAGGYEKIKKFHLENST